MCVCVWLREECVDRQSVPPVRLPEESQVMLEGWGEQARGWAELSCKCFTWRRSTQGQTAHQQLKLLAPWWQVYTPVTLLQPPHQSETFLSQMNIIKWSGRASCVNVHLWSLKHLLLFKSLIISHEGDKNDILHIFRVIVSISKFLNEWILVSLFSAASCQVLWILMY